jgi:hypothetical protein
VEQALALAEERLRTADSAGKGLVELVAVARDLAVGLGENLAAGNLSLGAKDGAIVIGIPQDDLFVPEQGALDPQALVLISSIASVAASHPSHRVELREPLSGTIGELRTQSLREALVEKGVPADRIVKICSTEAGAPAPVADAPASEPENSAANADAPVAPMPEASTAPPVAAPEPVPASKRYEIAFVRL